MAGDSIAVGLGALMMLHEPESVAYGTAEDVRREAAGLDKVVAAMVAIYARRSGASADQVVEWMQREEYFSANEGVSAELADTIL